MHDRAEVDHGDARPTRSPGLTFAALLLGAVLVAVVFGQIGQPADPGPSQRLPAAVVAPSAPDVPAPPRPDKPIGVESIRQCPVRLGGLALGDRRQVPEPAFERWDCDALKGPWSVVIRATNGHFGVHAAVVTFPVDRQTAGTVVAEPRGAVWTPGARRLVWPLAGAHAQIVGDVGQAQLAELAMHITVEAGKPHLGTLDGFTTAANITYRPPIVHEMRYSTTDLRQERRLGSGLVHTGLMSGASFESQALESGAKPAGFVRGQPATYSKAQGEQSATETLAWESAPGEVAYIGFNASGTPSAAMTQTETIEALRALADRGRPLTPAQWQAKDRIPAGRP